MQIVAQLVLVFALLIAAVLDIKGARIPNWLTLFPGLLVALGLQFAVSGTDGLLSGVAGWGAGLALLIGFYAAGGMGAGDVKLVAMVGAYTGPSQVFWITIYTALFGGVYAIGIVVYSLVTKGVEHGIGRLLSKEGLCVVLEGGGVQHLTATFREYPKLRYAVVVAVAVAVERFFGPPQF